MGHTKFALKELFKIHYLYSLHYFEFAKDFVFKGEKHNFWEILYVDKGEVEVLADKKGYNLHQGDMIFHKPNEFHSVWANKVIAPNLVVISFECLSPEIKYFENKLFSLSGSERNMMALIIKEGISSFAPPLNHPSVNRLVENKNAPKGSQQLIKINLELLLISIYRKNHIKETTPIERLSSIAKERSENEVIDRIKAYMHENAQCNITMNQLCNFSNISKSHLMSIFKEKLGMSVMAYFKLTKIEFAKTLIRESKKNFTEISDYLGFSSIHCFTRSFKNITGMTPTEYSKSIVSRG
jgi:AraC-like DNA-binding protein